MTKSRTFGVRLNAHMTARFEDYLANNDTTAQKILSTLIENLMASNEDVLGFDDESDYLADSAW